jgi:hypothetical protein
VIPLCFALEFRGRGTAVPGQPGLRRAVTTAPGQRFRTRPGADGIEAVAEPADGETATLEAEVRMTGTGTFVESGRIRYGTAGAVTFRTAGEGVRGPSPIPGLVHGAVIWEVTRGEGALAGARGLITSNFTVDATGAVVDRHVALLFVAEPPVWPENS